LFAQPAQNISCLENCIGYSYEGCAWLQHPQQANIISIKSTDQAIAPTHIRQYLATCTLASAQIQTMVV
jgi:hypothetical protein